MHVGHILLLIVSGMNQTHKHPMAEGASAAAMSSSTQNSAHQICDAPPNTQAQHDHHFTDIKQNNTTGIAYAQKESLIRKETRQGARRR